MTLTVTVLLGIGVLFIASALDNTPLVQTTQKILSNQPIDWTGASGSTTGVAPQATDIGSTAIAGVQQGKTGGNTTGRQFGQTTAS
jgi:hypothetical protein